MNDLFVTKVVSLKNIVMPADYSKWMQFINDRYYSEHPYIPKDNELNIVVENLDPGTQTAVGYVKINVNNIPLYTPLIIDKGHLYPFDLVVTPDGKVFGFSKEFYQSTVSKDAGVFGKAVKQNGGGRLQPIVSRISQEYLKSASLKQEPEVKLDYCLIKRASYNGYEISAKYSDGSEDTYMGKYTSLQKLGAEHLAEFMKVGEQQVLLTHNSDIQPVIASSPAKGAEKYITYETPGTYRVLLKDDETANGILLYAPAHHSSGKNMVYISKNFYSFVNNIKGFKISNDLTLDSSWIVTSPFLESIVPSLGDPEGGPDRVALYVYDNGGKSGLLISKIQTSIHTSEGKAYYKANLATGETVGLVCDPDVANGKLVDISNDESARGDFLKGFQGKVFQIGTSFLSIPSKMMLSNELTKTATYKGAIYNFSIKGGDYIISGNNLREAGKENLVKIAMGKLGLTEESYQALKARAALPGGVNFRCEVSE